ncbi:MAG TPA: hypothetical protein VFC00_37495 [Micromonosporaceae bacterium]|nr:hypothetical protein [Micromonosporaceae bacterium]
MPSSENGPAQARQPDDGEPGPGGTADWDVAGWGPEDWEPERAIHPAGPIVNGRVVKLDSGYAREVRVGQPLLVVILAAAGIFQATWLLLVSVLRRSSGQRGGRRGWKSIRKGPEYLVTPLRLRDTDGVLREVEIHGYVSPGVLEPKDLVRARVRRQHDKTLPPRVERIANLTTGQVLTPHPPTFWSHLGPALVVQALLGALLLASLVTCVIAFGG